MGLRPDQLIHAVLLCSLVLFCGWAVLLALALGRRVKQEKDSEKLRLTRVEIESILFHLSNQTLSSTAAFERLKKLIETRRRLAEESLFGEDALPVDLQLLQRLAKDLNMIQAWQSSLGEHPPVDGSSMSARIWRFRNHLRPLSYQDRAKSAHRLGRIRHHESWPLLAKALYDPSTDVQSAAVQSLLLIREPQAFSFLLERLRAVAGGVAGVSERELKAALARFPLEHARSLIPLLQDDRARLRSAAAAILQEMMAARVDSGKTLAWSARELGYELPHLIVGTLSEDEDPEVRAVAADLVGYLGDDRARLELIRLMADSKWYVRLHAVRAAARSRHDGWVSQLRIRLADRHWRVREAAAHGLIQCGSGGLRELLQLFKNSGDRYVREQVIETLEVSGIMGELTARSGGAGDCLNASVVEAVVETERARAFAQAARNRRRSVGDKLDDKDLV